MCFKPKTPKPVETPADPALARQVAQAELDASALKAENKSARMEDQLAALGRGYGRKSLFTGGQGGEGYPGRRRSLFSGPGAAPNSGVPGVTDPGPFGTWTPGSGTPAPRGGGPGAPQVSGPGNSGGVPGMGTTPGAAPGTVPSIDRGGNVGGGPTGAGSGLSDPLVQAITLGRRRRSLFSGSVNIA